MKKLTGIFLLGLFFGQSAWADTLDTPSFKVDIVSRCPEGNVTCDNVIYRGESKKTGTNVTLKGSTVHSPCADGTPCRFLGYAFQSGGTRYWVGENGVLEVTQGRKVLVRERGRWFD